MIPTIYVSMVLSQVGKAITAILISQCSLVHIGQSVSCPVDDFVQYLDLSFSEIKMMFIA